jgi:hypothetical protein
MVIACTLARPALDDDQRKHKHQQYRGQFSRRRAIAQAKPGAKDTSGEDAEPEKRNRSIVGQGFHQGKRHTGNNGRTRQRQRDAVKTRPHRAAQCPAYFQHAYRLFEESGAR